MNEKDTAIVRSDNLEVLSQSESGTQPISLKVEEIPIIIYTDLSANLGIEDEFVLSVNGFECRVRKLNPDHEATGFAGAIGYGTSREHVMFALWPGIPTGDSDSVFEPKPSIRLVAGPQRTGEWFAHAGDRMSHVIYADFGLDHPRMNSPAVALTALVLLRATQLARRPDVVQESYWWNERHKNG